MFALVISLVALLLTTTQAITTETDLASNTTTVLPQCTNLSLSWTPGRPPYTIVITEVPMHDKSSFHGLWKDSETLHSTAARITWTVVAKVGTRLTFIVTDSSNVTSAGGPYEVTASGDKSCLCKERSKRAKETRRKIVARYPSKLTMIMLPPVSRSDVWKFVGTRSRSRKRQTSDKVQTNGAPHKRPFCECDI